MSQQLKKNIVPVLLICCLPFARAESLKCVSHYESYRNKIKYAGTESYTEIIEYEKNKPQVIKTTVNGKLIAKDVSQDTIDGQTTNYSNNNNVLVRTSVIITDQNLFSTLYAQHIRNQGGGELSKEIRTADLEINLITGAMIRTSTIQTQREKYFTIAEGTCIRN